MKAGSSRSSIGFINSSEPVDSLLGKCSEMQEHVQKTRDFLLKNIKEGLEPTPDTEKTKQVFHKSINYIQRKEKIKDNVVLHKYRSSAKLSKLKSIVDTDYKHCIGKEFLSGEDIVNDEAIKFLNLNKRKFGESTQGKPLFIEKKKQLNVLQATGSFSPYKTCEAKVTKSEMVSPKMTPTLIQKIQFMKSRKSVDKSSKSPTNKFIISEMKKLWPPDSETINEKKRIILKMKIDKLQSILEEKSDSVLIEEEIIGGPVNANAKLKLDTMVHHHIRCLRKKLTLEV